MASLFQVLVWDEFVGAPTSAPDFGHIYGRLAAGLSARTNNWSIGRGIFPQPQHCPALSGADVFPYALLSSEVSITDGEVLNGHIGVVSPPIAGSVSAQVAENLHARECDVTQVNLNDVEFSFEEARKHVEAISKKLASLPPTIRQFLISSTRKLFMELGGPEVEVTRLNGAYLQKLTALVVSAEPVELTPGTTIVINVSGEDILMNDVDTTILTYPTRVIWNFYEAKNIYFKAGGIYGTILAPYARFKAKDATIFGSLYARSFQGVASFQPAAFDGCLPVTDVLPSLNFLVQKGRWKRSVEPPQTVTATQTVTQTVTETERCAPTAV
ncbi:hypothetical protein HDU85_001733 [Gaertneriomyces sp. JEL0708]|nr:hypothetical protein HDU85_001733 [Gaertneriomyces sp. JEL0708]